MTLTRLGHELGLGLLVSASLALAGCAKDAPKEDPASIDVNLAQYVLDEVPNDVKNPTFVDFEGRVQLIGWELEPAGVVAPGQKFKLKLYWRSSQKLGPGWSLFTHLVAPGGTRVDANVGGVAFDDIGPLRARGGASSPQVLGPAAWKPGKIYVDVQELEMPKNLATPEVSIMVGIWKPPARPNLEGNRLDPISGSADPERRAIVTTVKTGWVPPPPAARAERPVTKS